MPQVQRHLMLIVWANKAIRGRALQSTTCASAIQVLLGTGSEEPGPDQSASAGSGPRASHTKVSPTHTSKCRRFGEQRRED
jgi:hypothetical protein